MTSDQFVFWINGFFEISNDGAQELSAKQVQIIKDHLALVFKKETPVYEIDYGGIRLAGDRIQDGWLNGVPYYTGIEESQKDKFYQSDPNNVFKDIYIGHTPVEITQTYDDNMAFWPQVSC